MRFFLDNDVSADVGTALRRVGHECWTAANAQLAAAEDDELTVYACDRGACLITHDKEFSHRRKQHIIGRHIWLTCVEWDAAQTVLACLPDILPPLQRHDDIFIEIGTAGKLNINLGSWT